MTTVAQVRKAALAMPEVTEGTHFGMVAFRVRDKGFVSITKDDALQVQLDPADIDRTVRDLPGCEPLVRMGRPIGVRVPLAAINGMQSNALVRRAWLARAPKRLAASLQASDSSEPGEVGDLPRAIGRPATRALAAAGLTTLEQLAELTEAEIAALHGMGPKALRLLGQELAARGLHFRED